MLPIDYINIEESGVIAVIDEISLTGDLSVILLKSCKQPLAKLVQILFQISLASSKLLRKLKEDYILYPQSWKKNSGQRLHCQLTNVLQPAFTGLKGITIPESKAVKKLGISTCNDVSSYTQITRMAAKYIQLTG